MDKIYIAQRLKKYLFLISMLFVLLTSTHLIYSYIYSDAKETAIKGGSISEAIIGNVPNLNPLRNNSEQNKYINATLYRSLLTYDIKKKKIVGDLAKCDIRNLLQIECFLNENIKWSNGESITKEDVVKTFETLSANSKINPIISSLLKSAEIQTTETSIIFKNTKKDINFLKVFFQPIVSNKILNVISKKEMEGSFSLPNGIYSGKYKVTNISKDETIGITTITLEKNAEYYKNPVYIDTIFLKVFPSVSDLLRNKSTINIFNDKDNLIAGSIPRLEEHNYILPQYVSVFFNTLKIDNNILRNLISEEINSDDIISHLGEKKFQKVTTPFISDIYIEEEKQNSTLEKELTKQGYFSTTKILENLNTELKNEKEKSINALKNTIKTISSEVKIKATDNAAPDAQEFTITKIENPKSETIFSPNWVDQYNFITKNDILLEGKTDFKTTEVYINDYKLLGYSAGSSSFKYRISSARKNLKEGENNYKIYFVKDGEKEFIEEVNFFYNKDKEILKQQEKATLEKKTAIAPVVDSTPQPTIESIRENDDTENSTNKNPEEIKSEAYLEIENKIEDVSKLDNNYYYNKDLSRYSLELYYLSGKSDYKKTAEFIKLALNKKGLEVQLREITTQNLTELLSQGKKNYDMILAGVNLSYFDFNIYPYFHSSQIEKGYNLSNFRKLDLDIALEELKSKLLSQDKILQSEKKILKIVNENNLMKTIYTPILSNLVDKNIKGYSLEEHIPENIYRFAPIEKSYVKQDRFVITENKGALGYIKFLMETLF